MSACLLERSECNEPRLNFSSCEAPFLLRSQRPAARGAAVRAPARTSEAFRRSGLP